MGRRAGIKHDGGTTSLSLACYHAVYDYPGGVQAVSAVFGWNPRTLGNKLNPTIKSHLVNADEVTAILELTKDPRILQALGEPVGAVWTWLDEVRDELTDLDVLGSGAAVMDGSNRAIQEVIKALKDGAVDRVESGKINAAIHEAQRQLTVLKKLAEQFEE